MYSCSIVSREWKANFKTLFGIFSLFVIVLIVPRPVDALQTALVRASDGNVYQIEFRNEDLSGGYSISNFIDDFSIYNETGQVELCPGNDQSVTREIYTAARVLAQTPRNTPLFDTSPLATTLEQTAAELGIDQEGNVDVVGIVGDIVKEMAVDELQGQIQTVVDPSLNLGIATINLNTFKIKINASGPDIIVKPTEFLSELVGLEIELRWMLYAFSRASTYANTTIHLQALANQRAAALWDAINAGEVVDITGHAFTIHEDAIEISNKIGVFDPLRLRLAAGVYRAYAEYVAELGTDLAEHEGPVATLANRISVDIITEFLFTLSDAQSAMAEKDALDELDAQIPGDINTRLHANINGIYDAATSDLNQNGFCAPDLRFAAVPLTVPEGDTLTYTVALNSAPGFLAIISISSDNPDVTVSPTSLTFTSNNWYIPKRVGVDVSADADSIDESVSLSHVVAGYGGGMVREFQFDITDQVSNRAPEAIRTIPDQTLTVGDSSAPLDLPTYFHDPDDDTLLYTIESSDPNVATAQGVGSQFTIWTLNVGNTTVTVRATDPDDLFITQTFTVTVDPAPLPNQPPEAVNTIPVQSLTVPGLSRPVDVAPYFFSQSTLTYEADSNPNGIVTESVSGSQVTITPVREGSTSVVVTAFDSNDRSLSAIQTIPVTVRSNSATIVRPPSDPTFTPPTTTNPIVEGLADGVAVIVQNTIGKGLNIRSDPWIGNNKIGQFHDGAKGTIEGRSERNGDFTWWYIDWDGESIEGWCVEAFGGSQLLFPHPPDLEVRGFNVSDDEVEPGETFTIEATVRNNGPGESAATEIFFYYRKSDENTPLVAGSGKRNVPSLRERRSHEVSLSVEAPMIPGDYEYGAILPSDIPDDYDANLVDPTGEIRLNNTDHEDMEVTSAPDLIVESISANRSTVDPGEEFRLEAVVRNQGIGEPARSATLRYYRSRDANITTRDTEVGDDTISSSNLDTNDTTEKSESITAPIEPGVYYYGACVDLRFESNTRNNCSSAVAITVRETGPSDLIVSTPTLSASTLGPGQSLILTATVRNQGIGPAPATTLRGYRSANANISDVDTEVGAVSIGSLAPGATQAVELRGAAPVMAGTYYYGICVDDVTNESNTVNNCSTGVALTVENRAPSAVGTILPQTLSETDTSVAVDVAAYFTDPNNTMLIYTAVSANTAVVSTRVRGSEVTLTPINAGSAMVTVTASDGAFTATQTVSVSVVKTETKVSDLRVDSVSVDKNTVAPDETFQLSAVIKNQGEAASIATPLRYYLSTDTTISDTDTQVYATILPMVAASANGEPSVELTAPNTPGTYYYGVCIDAVEGESDTTNNCSTSVAITVKNRAPSAVSTLPPRTLSENDAPVAVDVAQYFTDPDNTALTYTAASANTAVVLVDVRGSQVTLTPVGAGDAIVTITASDGALTATQTLSVSVVATPTENEAPLAIGVIPVQSLTVDGASSTVDISAYFSDANGDPLTYAAWPDDKNVLGLRREGTLLTITPKAAGRATVTVRARDPDGLQALQSISVFVSTTEIPVTELPAETWMPDANLRAAVRDALGLAPNDALTQQAIQELTSLRYLGPDLSDNQKIADLTGLEYALNLEHLDLYMHLITDIRPLERLAKLRSLWLAGNKISNIRPLTRLPLEGLDLGGNPITDFTPLAQLTSLTRLDFWGNGLGDNNLQFITGLTQLTQLDLRNNQISDISSLTKLVNLKKLQLKGNPISDTAPLLDLTSQNPDLEIDIEISDEPPSEPETEIEAEVPDLVVESVRVNKDTVAPSDVFRLDALIKNQGKTPSGDATVRFYRSADETISTEDAEVRASDLPSVAVDGTRNRWARLTVPKTAGVYYYGVCIDGVADESDTENNCSTAVKITVGTAVTTDPDTGDQPSQGTSLAEQVFEKHGKILRRQDVKEVLPDVLTALKEPDTQVLLNPATIELVLADPDLLKKTVPTISDKFITLMKTDAEIKTLLSDAQVQTLLQTPAAIDELARLLGISITPPPTANEHWMPDANLRAAVRKALGLKPSEALTQRKMQGLTFLDASYYGRIVGNGTNDLTGLEHATQLTTLILVNHRVSDLSPLTGLTSLKDLDLTGTLTITDISPLRGLASLTDLDLTQSRITDLSPLADLKSLTDLRLFGTLIDDNDLTSLTSLLGGLTQLKKLYLGHNQINNITPLTNLADLTALGLQANQISDITPLQNLSTLTFLNLGHNQITDVSPLEGLTSLRSLHLSDNPIADLAPLRRLKAKNPNMWIDINLNVGAAPPAPVVPAETALLSNYPNPFNPETWIPYQLATSADVAVTIYDVRGVMVRRLALGHRPAGFYYSRGRAAHWDGRNELDEKVASGLYFYTFTAGDFTATQKLLIRK